MCKSRKYIAIDLKSFYASVECVARGLDPLRTNLVVADPGRTEKTICLAVSPSLKAYGISGRARLFEVIERVKEVNAARIKNAPGGKFKGKSSSDPALKSDASLELSYIVAPPRMSEYIAVSTRIHEIYLKYIAPEDICVYSIDEVFMDVTGYMDIYGLSAHDLAMKLMLEILSETGITATGGVGTNLYLCKVAMDIMAKHIQPDKHGVRIAELDEMSYRHQLWNHRPITDFWRVGRGYASRLEKMGIYTMGDIALYSTSQYGEDRLYKQFGVNAELLIDHAWGWEPCTMEDIRAYKPENKSLSSGQVFKEPYDYARTRLIVKEMTELLALELVEKKLVTNQLVLTIGYDIENISDKNRRKNYHGDISVDHYGRKVPRHAHGTENLHRSTSSARLLIDAALRLYDSITNKKLLVRRINITAEKVEDEDRAVMTTESFIVQLDLFTNYKAAEERFKTESAEIEKEKRIQKAELEIKKKFGKNAILKGINLLEGSTTIERNQQIGGHKA